MKRLIMGLVFAAIAAAGLGGYWYWQKTTSAGAEKAALKEAPVQPAVAAGRRTAAA